MSDMAIFRQSTSPQPSREKPTVTAITAEERTKLDERFRDKHERLRNRYAEINGKVVDWIHHYIEDGTLYVCIRFQDKTDFALEFSPQMVRVGTELCDSATEDFDVIRNYYQEEANDSRAGTLDGRRLMQRK